MNTVGTAASSAAACRYISLYTYIMLYDTCMVYVYYVCISLKSAFVKATKSTL
jgi:hypothetical protein